jgi:hypothetical protein
MNNLKLMAFMALIAGAQYAGAMNRNSNYPRAKKADLPDPNYCYDAIQKIKDADNYDQASLFQIIGIQNNDQDIYENRKRVLFIEQEIRISNDVDQAKKNAVTQFKDMINQRTNAYHERMGQPLETADQTKENSLLAVQKFINQTADEYAYKHYLPMVASPAIAIETKSTIIDQMRAAQNVHHALRVFFNINTLNINTIDEELYRKRKDLNEVFDAVRLNPK